MMEIKNIFFVGVMLAFFLPINKIGERGSQFFNTHCM